ncbi:alpha-L-rhamnosidase [Enterococcus lemanii]|uniref:alpha-L-rhamnosidase n=1 Tax=Enterococcus lemanii TaxID=1159752 RepID=A0ABV9MZY2_9ENTE|nr:alpha-L-rhamnosidase [Enterococcus lemanii]MBM7710218.1 alpha-L-rhamnosidase [Enterococcus lemanii]
MKITRLLINHMQQPIGISDKELTFTWLIESDIRNTKQKRYDLQVALDDQFEQVIWHQNEWSQQSTNLAYQGPDLVAKTIYFVRVKVEDFAGNESVWSETATFETGLLDSDQWKGQWVTTANQVINQKDQSFKPFTGLKYFSVDKPVKKARLYVSAYGIYSAYLNQEKIGADYFTPGWTDYHRRLQYQTYDITEALAFENTLTVTVAEGWYSGYLGWEKKKDTYGNFNAFIAQIEIEYEDGEQAIYGSDGSWSELSNHWLKADLYNGEIQDLTHQSQTLAPLQVVSMTKEVLIPQINEPVQKQEEIQPVALFKDPAGRLILDLGQNMVGWVKCRVQGEAGQMVTLVHGEILDKDGNFYRDNIRDAQQKDQFILTGEIDTLEPNFTFHGFRYVELINFPETIKKEDFVGIVLHSAMPETGYFETSDPLLNQLQHNILWGQKGNFLDVPTDCPQRDERLGWTADAQIFFPTASFNMNTYNFFRKWLKDLRDAQLESGEVPFVVPDVLKGVFANNASKTTAVWGDAATIIPWEMYQRFGDKAILQENYETMKRWVDYICGQGAEEFIWDTGMQLGDWLALDAEEGSFSGATDEALIATSYFAYSAEIVAKTAKVLGKHQDYKVYQQVHDNVKEKMHERFFTPAGQLISDTQTAHIIVLLFHLYPIDAKDKLVQRLIELIELKEKHLDTGFVGSPYICQVLAENGAIDLAYHLLFNRDLPSWLYQVEKGATTVWEHWDGIKADGSFWDEGMNSFNHYAYGSIGAWMYETIGGIKPKTPGYQQSIIAPKLNQQLTQATTRFKTLYGDLESAWSVKDNELTFAVKVPANTEAEIVLPKVSNLMLVQREIEASWQPIHVGEQTGESIVDLGIARFKVHQELSKPVHCQKDELLVFVGSGQYEITYQLGNEA